MIERRIELGGGCPLRLQYFGRARVVSASLTVESFIIVCIKTTSGVRLVHSYGLQTTLLL